MSIEKEFVEKNPLTYIHRDGRIVGVYYFDVEHFGENIDCRISFMLDQRTKLYEILTTTSDEEFAEIKRIAEIKYHKKEIERLEINNKH